MATGHWPALLGRKNEKKYFTKMIVSAINRLLLFLRGNVKNKKVINTDDKSNTEETNG